MLRRGKVFSGDVEGQRVVVVMNWLCRKTVSLLIIKEPLRISCWMEGATAFIYVATDGYLAGADIAISDHVKATAGCT